MPEKETHRKKSLLRRWERLLLLLALAVLLFFLARHFGLDPVEVTEDSRIIERPHR